jgi:hypothetical protein
MNAHKRAIVEFKTKGKLFPVWNPRAEGTQGYQWYSTRVFAEGFRAFADIMNHQYGPVRDGVLHAPNQKSFVPF